MRSYTSSTAVVSSKYAGRSELVAASDVRRLKATKAVIDACSDIEHLAQKSEDWRGVKQVAAEIASNLSNPDAIWPQYKVEILQDVVCPYLSAMTHRAVLDQNRFTQVRLLITHLNSPSTAHPATILIEMDSILAAIDSKSSWFRSELGDRLRKALELQWSTILTPIRY